MAMPVFKLNSFDELFAKTDISETTGADDEVIAPRKQDAPRLPLDCLKKSANNPFKPYVGDKLNELVESIREHGILTPILVRPLPVEQDGYEIIAGHNRVNAARIAGLEVIPAVIRPMDDDTAAILMVESNFQQRQEILPSEKAFAYKMQLDALKRQGKRSDLTSVQVEQRLSRNDVASMNHETASQIQRFIRLTSLSPELLESVDNNKLSFTPAVNISYLREAEQQALQEILADKKVKLSLAKSERLKAESAARELDREEILDILQEEKAKPATFKNVKIPFKSIADCFAGRNLSEQELVRTITIIVQQYYRDKGPIGREDSGGILSEQKTDSC